MPRFGGIWGVVSRRHAQNFIINSRGAGFSTPNTVPIATKRRSKMAAPIEIDSHGSLINSPNLENPNRTARPLGTEKYGKIEVPPIMPCVVLPCICLSRKKKKLTA